MKKFRIPRKLKKSLKHGFWLYPADENGNYLQAYPDENEADFNAYKSRIIDSLKERIDKKDKTIENFKKEIHIPDTQLKEYIDKLCAPRYRASSYEILIEAKNHNNTITYYYEFINTYRASKKEEYGCNICCLIIDTARTRVNEITFRKKEKRRNKKKC